MDESTFETLAEETLEHILEVLDDHLADHLDADVQGGVLTVDLDAGGQYVINAHRPNRQIWMSSPKSGATHFEFDEASGHWVSTRGGAHLDAMLAEELSQATGEGVSF